MTVNGQSLMSALSAWYFDGEAPVRVVDTSCTGWACHSNCRGVEEPVLVNGPNGAGGGGLGGGPPHPGQLDLPPTPPGENWQEQLAQARKAQAQTMGLTPSQYQQQVRPAVGCPHVHSQKHLSACLPASCHPRLALLPFRLPVII